MEGVSEGQMDRRAEIGGPVGRGPGWGRGGGVSSGIDLPARGRSRTNSGLGPFRRRGKENFSSREHRLCHKWVKNEILEQRRLF